MSECICERLGSRLQQPAHEFHQRIEHAVQQVAQATPRYLNALLRRPRPDPEREAVLERARARLQRIHRLGQSYLPSHDHETIAPDPARIRERLSIRREKDGRR